MNRASSRWTKAAMVILLGVLPAAAIDCDLRDSALRIDVDRYGRDPCYWDCGGYYYEADVYYYDYYTPWYHVW